MTFLIAGCVTLSGCGQSKPENNASTASGSSAANEQVTAEENKTVKPADNQPGFATPEQAFEEFKAAMAKDNWKTALSCLTDESQEMMAGILGMAVGFATLNETLAPAANALMEKYGLDPQGIGDSEEIDKTEFIVDAFTFLENNGQNSPGDGIKSTLGNATLADLTIDGDQAQAMLVDPSQQESEPIDFRQVDGRWFIQLPSNEEMAAATDSEMDFDGFDAGSTDDEMWANYPELGSPPPEAMSVEDFNASWQTDVHIANEPAGEALAKLAEEIGLTFEKPAEPNEVLNTKVNVSLEKKSRLQAIEDICRQIGMTPAYFPQMLKLKPEPRPYPVAFAGPFLIHVAELEERPPYATGRLTLRVYGAGLPATVGAAVGNEEEGSVVLTAAVDPNGNEVADIGQRSSGMSHSANRILDTSLDVMLKNLLKSVETFSVRGGIQFKLPTRVTVVTFDKLEAGATAKAGDAEFTIRDISLGEESLVSVDFKGVTLSKVKLICYDADKNTIRDYSTSSSFFNNQGNVESQLDGQLVSFEVRLIEESSDIAYEFAIPEIPLASFAEMPETIEPLKFEGEAPVTFEFVKFDGSADERMMFFKVTNHTNKPMESLEMKLEFRDADGKTIEKMPYMLGYGIDPVIDVGETKQLDFSASLMPEGTKSAMMTIERLSCYDATTWKLTEK